MIVHAQLRGPQGNCQLLDFQGLSRGICCCAPHLLKPHCSFPCDFVLAIVFSSQLSLHLPPSSHALVYSMSPSGAGSLLMCMLIRFQLSRFSSSTAVLLPQPLSFLTTQCPCSTASPICVGRRSRSSAAVFALLFPPCWGCMPTLRVGYLLEFP